MFNPTTIQHMISKLNAMNTEARGEPSLEWKRKLINKYLAHLARLQRGAYTVELVMRATEPEEDGEGANFFAQATAVAERMMFPEMFQGAGELAALKSIENADIIFVPHGVNAESESAFYFDSIWEGEFLGEVSGEVLEYAIRMEEAHG